MISLLAGVLFAAASAGFLTEDGHLDAAAFDFVKPGVTRTEVDKRLGKPWLSGQSVVIAGKIDLFVDALPTLDHRGIAKKPQPTDEVRYYDYRPLAHSSEFARIVFKANGTVWYALLPPKSSESTLEKARARYGRTFVTNRIERDNGHVVTVTTVHRLPDLGVGLVETSGRGITHRVVFPPEK